MFRLSAPGWRGRLWSRWVWRMPSCICLPGAWAVTQSLFPLALLSPGYSGLIFIEKDTQLDNFFLCVIRISYIHEVFYMSSFQMHTDTVRDIPVSRRLNLHAHHFPSLERCLKQFKQGQPFQTAHCCREPKQGSGICPAAEPHHWEMANINYFTHKWRHTYLVNLKCVYFPLEGSWRHTFQDIQPYLFIVRPHMTLQHTHPIKSFPS